MKKRILLFAFIILQILLFHHVLTLAKTPENYLKGKFYSSVKNNFLIANVVEKPSVKSAPSNNAVIGRYILPKKIFNNLKNQKKGKGGEVHITDAIQSLIFNNNKFVGHNFAGKYLDCGTLKGYVNSSNKISKL